MHAPAHRVLGLVCLVLSGWWLAAQPMPSRPEITVLPPANTVMLTQTVQVVFLTVTNFDVFTNLTARLQVTTNTIDLLDDGAPPDASAGDATFSGSFVVPPFPAPTNFVVRFTAFGQDMSITNEVGEVGPDSWVTNSVQVTYRAAVRPGNDDFATAIKIPTGGGIVTGSNEFATIEPAEPFHGNNPDVAASIWWTWAPTNNTSVLMDTAGSSFAPVLAVYAGTALETLRAVASSTNDVVNGLKANVVFNALAGTTYRIAVAGFNDAGVGTVRLHVVPNGQPDTVPPQVVVTEPEIDALVTNATLRVEGTAFDPDPDSTGVRLVALQLNDDPPQTATGTTSWSLALTLLPGANVVSVVAEDVAGNRSAPVLVQVCYSPVPNDDFANALEISGFSGDLVGTNDLATIESGEPQHAGNEGGHSVWYWFRAPATGSFHVTTEASAFDTLLAVYEGNQLTDLQLIAANDDAVPGREHSELTVALVRDRTYYIAIDGFGGATGLLALRFDFTPTETMLTLNLVAGPGGTVVPASGRYPQGSIQTITALPAADFTFTGWHGTVNTTQNPLFLVMDRDHTITASFQVVAYVEGFESGGFRSDLNWSSSGQAGWFVQPGVVYQGRFAAQSGRVSNGEQSSLVLVTSLLDGTGAFRIRVSSEAQWDGVEFYLNGILQQRWTGESDWDLYQFPVIGGINTLEWRYTKDANFSSGLDAAFVDNLYLPLATAEIVPMLRITRLPHGPLQIAIQGLPNLSYVIESAPDLAHWSGAFTNSSPSGSWVWVDTDFAGQPVRLYRARSR